MDPTKNVNQPSQFDYEQMLNKHEMKKNLGIVEKGFHKALRLFERITKFIFGSKEEFRTPLNTRRLGIIKNDFEAIKNHLNSHKSLHRSTLKDYRKDLNSMKTFLSTLQKYYKPKADKAKKHEKVENALKDIELILSEIEAKLQPSETKEAKQSENTEIESERTLEEPLKLEVQAKQQLSESIEEKKQKASEVKTEKAAETDEFAKISAKRDQGIKRIIDLKTQVKESLITVYEEIQGNDELKQDFIENLGYWLKVMSSENRELAQLHSKWKANASSEPSVADLQSFRELLVKGSESIHLSQATRNQLDDIHKHINELFIYRENVRHAVNSLEALFSQELSDEETDAYFRELESEPGTYDLYDLRDKMNKELKKDDLLTTENLNLLKDTISSFEKFIQERHAEEDIENLENKEIIESNAEEVQKIRDQLKEINQLFKHEDLEQAFTSILRKERK